MKKGYTLVELLAVITIIGLLTVLVVPNVNKLVKERKEKLYQNQESELVNIARQYMSNTPELYDAIDKYGHTYVSVSELCNKNYINCPVIDPRNKSDMNGFIRISVVNGDYVYKYYSDVGNIELIVELNGGVTTQEFSERYTDGEVLTLIEPTREGYKFLGWQVISGDSVLNNNELTIGVETTTIYALWQNYPRLTVELDGGVNNQTYEQRYDSGTVIELTPPTKDGNEFTSWVVMSGNSIISGNTLTIGTEDTVVRAVYGTCPAGTYSDNDNNTCISCPIGSYSESGSSSCTPCQNGTTTSGTGQTSCNATCSNSSNVTGWNTTTWNNGELVDLCGIDTCTTNYKVENGQCVLNIINCAVGTYLPANGTSCSTCPAGSYCDGGTFTFGSDIDQGITGTCAAGTYSAAGASSCSTCTGNKTSTAGASSCTVACSNSTGVASWSTTATCTAVTCNANYYRNGANCTACAGGTTTSAGNSSTSCSTCSNSANASTWSGLGCTIATCKSGYKLSGNKCVVNTCTVYCTSASNCSKTIPSTNDQYGVFTCTNGKTGSIQSCWVKNTQCDGGFMKKDGNPPTKVCTTTETWQDLAYQCNVNLGSYCCTSIGTNYVHGLGLSGSGYNCSC